jgi:uncharacterized protein YidB (DUF937 family)
MFRLGLSPQEITMGLLDILNGMQNGPRGPSDPNDTSGGMSPITMAILAMLAYKGYKHFTGNQNAPVNIPSSSNATQASLPEHGASGGLGEILGGLFGGHPGQPQSGGLGDLLKGGLGGLLEQFQQNGQGETANSWVANGPNKPIAPNDLGAALGAEQIDQLTARTGMSRDQLLSELSNELPDAINHFTPHGRLPTDDEATRL